MGSDTSSRLPLLLVANLLIPLACLIFASGFFPYKPLLPGLSTFEDQDRIEELGLLREGKDGDGVSPQRPDRLFNKVIFMVVDALRSDFVYNSKSGFEFTQGLIRDGAVLPFTAHAAPPTVTMPRVKALTTGSVPSFVDLILNFAESDKSSSLAQQDTWLAQIKTHVPTGETQPGSLVFYGDDTWLKLFPDFFAHSDGTSSFFVSDFTEVDNNVTRHIPSTLESQDWNALVMHYLGLDHIGHKTGPDGPNMLPKQREMDSIVATIYNAIENEKHLKDTVLVVAGDHGMNSAGNHGGSAAGETSTALLFVSPKFKYISKNRKAFDAPAVPRPGTEFDYYTKVQQSDLVPSLCALLGLPFPKNNLGVIMPEVLDLWKGSKGPGGMRPSVHLLYRNALQVLEIVKGQYGQAGFVGSSAADKLPECTHSGKQQLQCLWTRAQRLVQAACHSEEEEANALLGFLNEAQDQLSTTASSYDVSRLILGILVATNASILVFWSNLPSYVGSASTLTFFLLTALYSGMMFASSYVEEEQHIWYWMTAGWLALLAATRLAGTTIPRITAGCGVGLVLIHRISNRWNQTGQKHAGEADISGVFSADNRYVVWVLWILVCITYFHVATSMANRTLKDILPDALTLSFSMVVAFTAWVFKLNFTQADAPELVRGNFDTIQNISSQWDLVSQARAVFAILALICFVVVLQHSNTTASTTGPSDQTGSRRLTLAGRLHAPLQLFLMTQSRTTNVPVFLLYSIQLAILPILLRPVATTSDNGLQQGQKAALVTKTSVTILLLAYASYFQTGGSNAISSIDLSNAYNGVASYNIAAVGILVFVSNWAGPIWWTTAGIVLLQMFQEPKVVKPSLGTALDALRAELDGKRKRIPSKSASTPTPAETGDSPFQTFYALMTIFTATSLAATMLACTVLRTHLFIWTVFSPKYLYAVAWAIGWHGLVSGALGAILWWAD